MITPEELEEANSRAEALAEYSHYKALRAQRFAQEDCLHRDKDHSICLECGKDCLDDDIAAAEDAADAARDRAWGI